MSLYYYYLLFLIPLTHSFILFTTYLPSNISFLALRGAEYLMLVEWCRCLFFAFKRFALCLSASKMSLGVFCCCCCWSLSCLLPLGRFIVGVDIPDDDDEEEAERLSREAGDTPFSAVAAVAVADDDADASVISVDDDDDVE